jgi:LPS sulfotransferase NodH
MANPIFVMGAPRSGTTLLRLLLTTHSDICIPPESLFFLALEPRYSNGNICVENFLNDLYSKNFPKFCEWNIDRQLLLNNLKRYQELNYALAVEAVYQTYRQQFDSKALVWGDKNPCHIHHVDKIQRHFPESKIILIIRDFRACYSSMKNIIAKEQDSKKVWTGPKTLEGMTRQWNQVIDLVDKHHQRSEQFYLIYYENLVREPVAQLTKVCEWLGVSFQEPMLSFYQRNVKLGLVLSSQIVLNPNTFKPINSERVDAWKGELSLADVGAVRLMHGESLKKLGYVLD